MKANPLVQKMDGKSLSVRPTAQVIALRQRDPWNEASEKQRDVARARMVIVEKILDMESNGFRSSNMAVETLLAKAEVGNLHSHLMWAMQTAAKAGRAFPSRSAVFEWLKVVSAGGGRVDLLEQHKGKVVKEQPAWWGPALEYYNQPGSPEMSVVWRQLAEVDGFACTYDQVRHYLSSVPAMLGRHSPARIGRRLYRLTEKAYIRRCTERALPGDVYVADGYMADIFLFNPVTGKLMWRPELTVCMDLRSRVIPGWRMDEHEGTTAVQNLWAETFARWNHVPLFLYVDNGSGHKNKLMSDEVTGFYARHNIEVIHAIPGNPHGKGWIERFFVEVKRDFLKMWRPAFYCGDDMSDEARAETRKQTEKAFKEGRINPPTPQEFAEAFNAWLARYHQRPHPENKYVTRASLWADLSPLPPHADLDEMKRQAVTLTVRRASVKHCKVEYGHPDLHAYNHKEVVLEYDLMDYSVGVIRTLDGRWICNANLITAIDPIAPNRMAKKRLDREENQQKRVQRKLDELKEQAGIFIDADAVASDAQTLLDQTPAQPETIEIDLFNFD
ncbi:Mu transposase C-terminal domain-containing protein [Methylomonas rosea]|uniref:DDE-type integrase/transposase/recombinase n=1 Tax=Methylomonas rosea TaxID=2952227 RepID=A0ABT1TMW2_9GAMM|nr:Mu transposase C-terminal domain-containing protein [Methylomonas sp. WSC-7]MCQ8116120.1 DDE-type integrase/transposase/recombinase [Methylomonas sp. WSC-7]